MHESRRSEIVSKVALRIGRLQTSNYDISNVCNLRCQGCLYFSGAGEEILQEESNIFAWQSFFASEAERGINFAYLAGAEPSLVPDRIRACHDHIAMGVVFTNGTKRIDTDITYRIHVSVWGDDAGSKIYRGASINKRAMTNYAGDPRAVFVMTLNALNLDEIGNVAQGCHDHAVPLTFSLFSPTLDYARQIDSSTSADLRFDGQQLQTAREAIFRASEAFPDTIKISPSFIEWLTRGESLYALDSEGVAVDCGNRLTRRHLHYNADLRRNSGKCCSPNIDCRDCRAYAMSLATYFSRRRQMPEDWERVWTFWSDLFLPLPQNLQTEEGPALAVLT